jgi:hypothetical protein
MPILAHRLVAATLFSAFATAALAAASSVPVDYRPDPALKRASRGELEARLRRACTVIQARRQNTSETALGGPCTCYASRTMRSLNEGEIQSYRDTGVFNDGARAKAFAALDACKLPRPA